MFFNTFEFNELLCCWVNQSRSLFPPVSTVFWNTDTIPLATTLISPGRIITIDILQFWIFLKVRDWYRFFGLFYLLLWILHFQKILSISVLFRSLTVDFFFTAWSWWETQTQISLIFCWKPKQIALHGQNGFPTSNQRVLRLDLGISKPHAN